MSATGTTLTDLSRRRFQTDGAEPRYELYIGGEVFTDRVREITASFGSDAGGSELSFVSLDPIDDFAEAPVSLHLGYGDDREKQMRPFFSGKLLRPASPDNSFFQTSKAYGPFADMARQFFLRETEYRGRFIDSVLYDICRRAGLSGGSVEVRSGRSFVIDEQVFAEEVSLLEAAKAIVENAGFVMSDMPGPYGRRLFLPAPKPGGTDRVKAIYTEDDYSPGALSVTPKHEAAYSEVVVFRRDANGGYAVRERAVVRNSGRFSVPKNRAYYVTDFPGDAKQAKQTAYDIARAIISGEFDFELAVPVNPDLEKFEQIEFQRVRERRDGNYRETYTGRILDSVSVDVAAWEMTLSGDALLVDEVKIAPPHIEIGFSSGMVRLPFRGLVPSEDLTPASDLVPLG